MSDFKPTEKKFENHIENHLLSTGYVSHHFSEYDRTLCLIRDEVINFIKTTQPENWGRLEEIYEIDVENKVLSIVDRGNRTFLKFLTELAFLNNVNVLFLDLLRMQL